MGLAIDGNVVHGIARGGQAFVAMQANNDGTININGNVFTQIPKFNQIYGYSMQAKQDHDDTSQRDLVAEFTESNSDDVNTQKLFGKKVIMFLMWQSGYSFAYEMLVTQPFLFATPSSNGFAVMDNIKPLIYSDTLNTSNIKIIYNAGEALTVFGLPAVGNMTGAQAGVQAYVSFGYQGDK